MSDKSKGGGPKTDKGKAISSRNSITHGLTAKNWINDDEQALFDTTVEALTHDFNPQSHIEQMLIAKLAECTVRLTRIQRVEGAMFDLTSSEATHPDLSIQSLSNNNEDLSQAVKDTSPLKLEFNPNRFNEKTNLLDEIKDHKLDDISNWEYVEINMPCTTTYIIQECLNDNITLPDLLEQEPSNPNAMQIVFVGAKQEGSEIEKDQALTISKIKEGSENIKPSELYKYLENLSQAAIQDLQVQNVLKNLDERVQQVKNSAITDTQKLSLVQRYRTADERQFSKTLGELF